MLTSISDGLLTTSPRRRSEPWASTIAWDAAKNAASVPRVSGETA